MRHDHSKSCGPIKYLKCDNELLFHGSSSVGQSSFGHTYIDVDSCPVESGDWRRVPWHVAIELVAVLVPLDGVEAVTLQIEVTLELGGGCPQYVVRYSHLR